MKKSKKTKKTKTSTILYDQHFCIDSSLIQALIEAAALEKKDVVLEIGPGKGALTKELSKHVHKVIAVEIDEKLSPVLQNLPKNVELLFGNALEILPKQQDFSKIVANLPYQICEPLLHFLCLTRYVRKAVLTVPKHFAQSAQKHPLFSTFLDIQIIRDVPQESFSPPPKVMSAVIVITKNKNSSDGAIIRRQLYLQRDKKLKNGLREGLIYLYGYKHQKQLTKKQADEIIKKSSIEKELLEILIARLSLSQYTEIAEKIEQLNL